MAKREKREREGDPAEQRPSTGTSTVRAIPKLNHPGSEVWVSTSSAYPWCLQLAVGFYEDWACMSFQTLQGLITSIHKIHNVSPKAQYYTAYKQVEK